MDRQNPRGEGETVAFTNKALRGREEPGLARSGPLLRPNAFGITLSFCHSILETSPARCAKIGQMP